MLCKTRNKQANKHAKDDVVKGEVVEEYVVGGTVIPLQQQV